MKNLSKINHTVKNLHKRRIKYRQIMNYYKFRINTTGSLTINENSTITITQSQHLQK